MHYLLQNTFIVSTYVYIHIYVTFPLSCHFDCR